jgi:hypothetical protein
MKSATPPCRLMGVPAVLLAVRTGVTMWLPRSASRTYRVAPFKDSLAANGRPRLSARRPNGIRVGGRLR